ncbi:MAG: T9SS type A sorting domain-containing protein [Flavobacteriales bacterium]|nr:T9SS type A sorting domain-containing protein [Flavobacteriales bacterium]
MNIKKITLFTAACLTAIAGVFLLNDSSTERYFPRTTSAFDLANQEANGAFEYLASIRNDRVTGIVSTQDVANAKRHASKMKKGNKSLDVSWSFKGPDNVGGRTRAFMIDNADTNHLFAGGVAGGLWESNNAGQSWFPYDNSFSVVTISTIAQAPNGTIYVGTGSGFEGGNNKGKGSNFVGTGLYKLTGNGTYEQLVAPSESLDPNDTDSLNYNLPWSTINEIAIDPNNSQRIWVAMNEGIQESTDGGVTWDVPANSPNPGSTLRADDVQMSDDGKITVSYVNTVFTSRDNGLTWASRSFSGGSRVEVAIAPSNSDIMYAGVAQFGASCTQGVHRTSDGGLTWAELQFTPDYFSAGGNCQGRYDNAIIVYPNDPGRILVGGINLFEWRKNPNGTSPSQGDWRSIATTNEFNFQDGSRNLNYVHADKHGFVFHPSNVNKLYVVTDGGIAFTNNATDLRPLFGQYNLGYNVTQFYDIAINGQDIALGGAQDNGTQLVGFDFNTGKSAHEVNGGDGFECELFMINPKLGFVSSQFGSYGRLQGIGTSLGASTFNTANVFSGKLADICNISGGSCSGTATFYTTMAKWESFNHPETNDSVPVILTFSTLPPMVSGTIIPYESKNNSLPLQDTITSDVFPAQGDTIWASVNKIDTLTQALNLNGITTIITAFDTILVNALTDSVEFRYRGKASEIRKFSYGTRVNYTNEFYNPSTTSKNLSILVSADSSVIQYIDPKIEFVYRYEFPDLVQSAVAVFNIRGADPTNNTDNNRKDIWLSKDLLKGSSVNEPKWVLLANSQSLPTPSRELSILCASFSNDGDNLFYGTVGGEVYRIDNINEIDVSILGTDKPDNFTIVNTVSQRRIGQFNGRAVTSVAVDPQNSDNIIVTLGNYGSAQYVRRSSNARSNGVVEFEDITGMGPDALPTAPVYEAMIDFRDNNKVLLATELGVFGTENAFTSNSFPVDTTYISQDTAYIVGDTTIIPADTILLTPADTVIMPADTIVNHDTTIVMDTLIIPTQIRIDSTVIPPDTIVLDSVMIITSNSSITIRDTSYIAADSMFNDAVFDTIPPDTISFIAADTIITVADTIIGTLPDVKWTEENTGLGRVPVHAIKQMTFGWAEGARNQGKIYIGTHGRGIFETDQFVGLEDRADDSRASSTKKNGLLVYPNPVVDKLKVDVSTNAAGIANIQIFSLTGQLVRDLTQNLVKGDNIISLQMGELDRGTYIIRTIQNGVTSTGKFIKQ